MKFSRLDMKLRLGFRRKCFDEIKTQIWINIETDNLISIRTWNTWGTKIIYKFTSIITLMFKQLFYRKIITSTYEWHEQLVNTIIELTIFRLLFGLKLIHFYHFELISNNCNSCNYYINYSLGANPLDWCMVLWL